MRYNLRYTMGMKTAISLGCLPASIRKGYGSILRIAQTPAKPPYLIHRFFVKTPNALEALERDWNLVSTEFAGVAKQEMEDAEGKIHRN